LPVQASDNQDGRYMRTGTVMMKANFLILMVALLVLPGCDDASVTRDASSSMNPDGGLDDIIAANTVALGGAAALDSVTTLVKRTRIEEGENRYIAVFATDRQARMRLDIFADNERVFAESYDGSAGHQWRPGDGQSPASERGTVALSHTPQMPNHIFRLKDVVANGHRLELLGSEEFDDRSYHVVKLTLADGFENFLFVDSESSLVTRVRSERALHVDIDDDQKVIETLVGDFRRVGDILQSHNAREVDIRAGKVLSHYTLLSMELNVDLPTDYFTDLVGQVPEESAGN
jgi:hypothetical protein